jgi:hypothetical protein
MTLSVPLFLCNAAVEGERGKKMVQDLLEGLGHVHVRNNC